jgi:sucrose phosphorylase
MSDHTESHATPWAEPLARIYPREIADAVSDRIDALLAKYNDVADHSRVRVLSQSDVMLITYGDTLYDSEPPLEVLGRFQREYLEGTFDLVHILPFHPYSSDDGFAVIDYYAVREDLGGWSDIEVLAEHGRIMADAVINHVSSESDWLRAYLSGEPEFADFFVECVPDDDLSAVTRPRMSPLLTPFTDTDGNIHYLWTTFSEDQVDLNYRNPDVLVAVLDVLFFLIAKGALLLRLDAVTYLWKEPGTSSANMPETHAIIKVIRAAVSQLRSDVVLVTETNVPHHENIAYFGNGRDEAHMVYNFALPPLIAHSLINGDGTRLSEWARRLTLPGDEVCFLNFSASHDGVGVRPVEEILSDEELQRLVDAARDTGGLVSFRRMSDGRERPYELNCSYIDLLASPADSVTILVKRFIASQAIVLSMPGVPAVYIQSLLGTRNDLRGVEQTGRARSINRPRHDYQDIKNLLEDENSMPAMVFEALRDLVGVRRRHHAFDPYGDFEILDLGKELFAIRRCSEQSGEAIVCIVNLTDRAQRARIDVAGRDVLSGDHIERGVTELTPYAVRWIQCKTEN